LYANCDTSYGYVIQGNIVIDIVECENYSNCNGFFICDDNCINRENEFNYSYQYYDFKTGETYDYMGGYDQSCNECYTYFKDNEIYLSCNCDTLRPYVYSRSSIQVNFNSDSEINNCNGFLTTNETCPEFDPLGYYDVNCCPHLPGYFFDSYDKCVSMLDTELICSVSEDYDPSSLNIKNCVDIGSDSINDLACGQYYECDAPSDDDNCSMVWYITFLTISTFALLMITIISIVMIYKYKFAIRRLDTLQNQ